MLSAHYRSPLNFSADLMEASKNSLERILTAMDRLRDLDGKASGDVLTEKEQADVAAAKELIAKYEAAMMMTSIQQMQFLQYLSWLS